MSAEWPWVVLGLDGPASLRDVKRAYAKTLKTIDRSDPEAFQALRDALDNASKQAGNETATSGRSRPRISQLVQEVDEGSVSSTITSNEAVAETAADPENSEQLVFEQTPLHEKQPAQEEHSRESVALDEPEYTQATAHSQPTQLNQAEQSTLEHSTVETSSRAPGDLDYESTAENEEGELELYKKVEELIEAKRYKPLADLFNHPAFQHRKVRAKIEERLADVVADYARANKSVPKDLAQEIEAEFTWVSDAIGTRPRLKRYGYDAPLINFVAVRLKGQSNPAVLKPQPKEVPPDERLNTKTWIIAGGFLSLVGWAVYQGVKSDDSFIAHFIITFLASSLLVVLFMLPFKGLIFLLRPVWWAQEDHITKFLHWVLPRRFVKWWEWQDFDADDIPLIVGFTIWWGMTLTTLIRPDALPL